MEKLFAMFAPSARAPTTNLEGYPAFHRPLEEQYLQALLTNTFGTTFYASERSLVAEAEQLHAAMLAKDPSFAAKALAYARVRGFMRTQPIYGLARLAGTDRTRFAETFGEVVRTPADLADFAVVVHGVRKGEGGRAVKRVAGSWLLGNLTEYWAVKYGSARSGGYSLRDLFRVWHPKPSGAPSPLVSWVLGRASPQALSDLPQVRAFEALKKASTDEEKVRCIEEGRLPHEVSTSFAGSSQRVWRSIVAQMPIFATLRHLKTLERHGVMSAVRDRVVGVLSDRRAVQHSRILPFRFLEAASHVTDERVKDALRDAVELSFASVPEVEGRTAVFLDISGSMGAYVTRAALFAVSLMKKARGNGRILLFDDRVEDFPVSMRDSVLTQASRVQARGGTRTDLPMRTVLAEREHFDNVVLVTDEQQNMGSPFMDVLAEYRRKVAAGCRAFVLNVAPYRGTLLPDDGLNHWVYGWSDQALQYIALASKGWGTFVDHVAKGTFEKEVIDPE